MRYFKVRSGTHADEKGNIYTQGDTISTEMDLAKMFPNKFDELTGEEADKAASNNQDKHPVEKLERVKAQRRGGMVPNEGTTEDKGDTPVDTKKLTEGKETGERIAGETDTEDGDKKGTGKEEEDSTTDYGEDVTSLFSQAEEGGLKVFRDEAGFYRVCSADDPDRVLEECATKKDATAAIKRQTK